MASKRKEKLEKEREDEESSKNFFDIMFDFCNMENYLFPGKTNVNS